MELMSDWGEALGGSGEEMVVGEREPLSHSLRPQMTPHCWMPIPRLW